MSSAKRTARVNDDHLPCLRGGPPHAQKKIDESEYKCDPKKKAEIIFTACIVDFVHLDVRGEERKDQGDWRNHSMPEPGHGTCHASLRIGLIDERVRTG